MKKISDKFRKSCPIIFMLLLSILWFLEFELGNVNDFSTFKIPYIILNIGTIFVMTLIVNVVSNSIIVLTLFLNVIIFVLSVANYFVVKLRGTPLSTKDVKNLGTALNVLDSYSFHFGRAFWCVLFLFLINFVLIFVFWKFFTRKRMHLWKSIPLRIVMLFFCIVFMYVCYFSPNSIKPKKTLGWSWEVAYYQYGYMAVSMEIIDSSIHLVDKPVAYSEQRLNEYEDTLAKYGESGKSDLPNIILIINESWYDLRQIADLETNMEISPFIDNMEGIQKGFSVMSGLAQGTNLAEYEVITGNSLQLMQGVTPFNMLNLQEANSIVSILNRNGYQSVSLHPGPDINYNRNIAYPALQIKESFWREDFSSWDFERSNWHATDKSNYENLMTIYEEKAEEGKVFLYNLTIQNHGDYLLNDTDDNYIKVLDGIDDITVKHMTEEYLTCLNKTDEAFQWLTEYLSHREEPVIVMMVGDHAPRFVDDAVNRSELSREEILLYEHSTPFVIWSNYGLEEKDYGYLSANYLPALLLDCAGVPSSQYYSWMVHELMPYIPVITSFNQYIDAEGTYYSYDENVDSLTEKLEMYFNLEYDNIKGRTHIEYFK